MNMSSPNIIIAIDKNNQSDAIKLAAMLDPKLCRLKVGLELFTAEGPAILEVLQKQGFEIFLDLKFHDIPNTVARACTVAAGMGVWMINVHALGGLAMMSAAREAISKTSHQPLLIAVTILTSHDQKDLSAAGITMNVGECVIQYAQNARQAGCDGVVCSALEAGKLRKELGDDFILVTPGIRPGGSKSNDQKRVVSPAAAIMSGANYLVIGRPVTDADDPAQALLNIHESIKKA
ncbi:MAG: orotidine-5'-phosphate decarboxylase [Acidiferrobacterales bacterium]